MPWCPKCKNEYKEGFTVCADCGLELVESLQDDYIIVSKGPENELKCMCDFMRANGITNSKIEYNEEENIYNLYVEPRNEAEAKKQLQVYISKIATPELLAKEAQRIRDEEIEIQETESYRGPYQEVSERADEYKSGADSLLIIGILGIIVLVLLNLGIIPISLTTFSKMLVTSVMGVMFVIFIVMGISSRKSYLDLKKEAGVEKNLKNELQNYLREQINIEVFDEDLTEDSPADEILYFRRIDKMKDILKQKGDSLDGAFVDYIIEETYSEIFE